MISDPSSLVGKTILIGITKMNVKGEVVEQLQMHGTVSEATEDGFTIKLSTGEDYSLPPHYENVFPARPGEYRLRSTGEVVVNPDFTTTWTIYPPKTH